MFLVTHFLGKIFLYLLTWVEISAQNLTRFIFSPMRKIKKVFVGFWDFVWTTNFNLTIRILSREADILLISGFVSVYEIGLFKIAKQLGQILSLIVDPIYQTIFPELSKLWIKKDYHNFINIRKRIFKIGFFVSILSWTTFLLFGKFAINIFFGEEFINVYYLTITYSIAIIISVITVSYQPTLLAIGDPKRAFLANIVATILYFVSLFFLLPLIGIQGASLSYISYYLAWSALMNNFINKHLREVKE
jgi:O-antigen/teichoic acid export membrane protein